MIPGLVNEEDVTTYQERLGSYFKKMLQRSKRIFWKLLEEDVTTYQERLGSYLKKMLRRSNVATSLKPRRKNVITPPPMKRTPPKHPPPKHTICKSDNSPALRGAPPPQTTP